MSETIIEGGWTPSATLKATGYVKPTTVYWVVTDPTTGVVIRKGHGPSQNIGLMLKQAGAVQITAEQYAQLRRAGKAALVNGQITPVPAATGNLNALRASYSAKVDQAAERARAKYLPQGPGQILEYIATLKEAQAVTASPDPIDATQFPWLESDVAAVGGTLTLRQAAERVIDANALWETAGVKIRQASQAAKAAIGQATTPAQMQVIISGLRMS